MSHPHHGHAHAHDHGHEHRHAPGHGHPHGRGGSERRLKIALGLLGSFTIVEAAGGFWANSIALLAEAAHMLADGAALALAIVAIRMARQPASAHRTYGNQRYQTLAAYTNGVALLVLTAWVVIEAAHRLLAPPPVHASMMLTVAALGGIANVAAFLALSGTGSLNERGARAHVLSDLLGSLAAMAAAGVILATGWLPADALLSILISALIFRSGWSLTHETAHVLLEGTPRGFDPARVASSLQSLQGIGEVHHVHAWSLTGDEPMVTLHARLEAGADRQRALAAIVTTLRERFGVGHATVQIEDECTSPGHTEECHDPETGSRHGHAH